MNVLEGRNLAHLYLTASLCALLAFPVLGQTAQSAQQCMETVQNHLSRYVVIRDTLNNEMSLVSQMNVLSVCCGHYHTHSECRD